MALMTSALGRAALPKIVSHLSSKADILIQLRTTPDENDAWLIDIGEPGANLRLHASVSPETLAEILEIAIQAWVQDSPISWEVLQPIILQALKAQKG